MKKWFHYNIYHAQKSTVSLYCREQENELLIYLTHELDGTIAYLIRDSIKAKLNELFLNQYSDPIPWINVEKDFPKAQWEFDMLEARKRNGNSNGIDYLKFHLANAINDTQHYRGFSRYAKKKILGEWSNADIRISFYENGRYVWRNLTQKKNQIRSSPPKGIWNISSNMLYVMNATNTKGQRILMVDVNDTALTFLGDYGQLFYILEKNKYQKQIKKPH